MRSRSYARLRSMSLTLVSSGLIRAREKDDNPSTPVPTPGRASRFWPAEAQGRAGTPGAAYSSSAEAATGRAPGAQTLAPKQRTLAAA